MTFKELNIGQTFDFIDDGNIMYNSFYRRCKKISVYRYTAEGFDEPLRIGSISAPVFHVDDRE